MVRQHSLNHLSPKEIQEKGTREFSFYFLLPTIKQPANIISLHDISVQDVIS